MDNEAESKKIKRMESFMLELSTLSEIKLAMVIGFSKGLSAIKDASPPDCYDPETVFPLESIFNEFRQSVMSLDSSIIEKKYSRRITFKYGGSTVVAAEKQKTQINLEFKFNKDFTLDEHPSLKTKSVRYADGQATVKFILKSSKDLTKAAEYVKLAFDSLLTS